MSDRKFSVTKFVNYLSNMTRSMTKYQLHKQKQFVCGLNMIVMKNHSSTYYKIKPSALSCGRTEREQTNASKTKSKNKKVNHNSNLD